MSAGTTLALAVDVAGVVDVVDAADVVVAVITDYLAKRKLGKLIYSNFQI
jgi:hypothetical protein